MLVLFDQGTPVPIRPFLKERTVQTTAQRGWDKLKNGAAAPFLVRLLRRSALGFHSKLSIPRLRLVRLSWLERCPAILSAEYLPCYQLVFVKYAFPHSNQVAQRGVAVYICIYKDGKRKFMGRLLHTEDLGRHLDDTSRVPQFRLIMNTVLSSMRSCSLIWRR